MNYTNDNNITNEIKSENLRARAVLAAVDCGEYDAESSMKELEELAKTAGAEVVAQIIQKRPAPEPATVLGEGKVDELKELVERFGADLVSLPPAEYAISRI